jgi:signal transduction histidine kinase/ActR/RegA family two-component response regulator
MAFGELSGSTFASFGVAVALVIGVGRENRSTTLWWWLAAMGAIAGFRLWLAAAFKKAAPPDAACRQWESLLVGATTCTGIGWGASIWMVPTFRIGSPLGVAHVLVLAGLVTGSARLLLPLLGGSIAYLVAVMIPLAAYFFLQASLVGTLLGTCVLVFIAYMVSAIVHNHRMVARAITLRFQHEELASQLEQKNAQHLRRETELGEARERAESASRAKGEFLATISHEIRTPMNGVLGMLRVVRDTPLSAQQRDYLNTASDSAESLLLLLNDVLDFSKIEAGHLELERAPFAPAATARAVADLLVARARDKGLQLDVDLADNLPAAIVGDAARLRQILVNLVGNAIKFTERGRVELAVACVERSPERATLHFTVTDTGIGIDSAALDRLFKPFTQADTSMSRRYGGTGLGLAISMRLAQAMGGTLQVQSKLHHGTTFRLILPCPLPDVRAAEPTGSQTRFIVPSLRGRVLVVEDDTINQQVIELFLKKLQLTPLFATDGEAAVAVVARDPVDIVLMDCQLPGIDGLEATRRIRHNRPAQRLPIVALTANASTHVREACLAAGMDDFLSKPVRFELLTAMLQRHLPTSDT